MRQLHFSTLFSVDIAVPKQKWKKVSTIYLTLSKIFSYDIPRNENRDLR